MTVLWMPRLNPPASPATKSQPHLSVRRQSSTDSHTMDSIPAAGPYDSAMIVRRQKKTLVVSADEASSPAVRQPPISRTIR